MAVIRDIMAAFELYQPTSVGDAQKLLEKHVCGGVPRRLWRLPFTGFANFVPATQTDNSQFWLRGIRQH